MYSATTLAQKPDPVEDAKTICHHQAVEKSGYNPREAKSNNTAAKGAAVGAAGGAAVRAIQGKSLVKGAAIGAVAGTGAGAIKQNKDKKKAVAGEGEYKKAYDSCLESRGFDPGKVQ
jgi:hypothetical protein